MRQNLNRKKVKPKQNKLIYLILTMIILLLLAVIIILLTHPAKLFRIQQAFSDHREKQQWTDDIQYELAPYQLAEQNNWREEQSLLLVNQEHPLPEDFQPALAEYRDSGVLMNEAILTAYGNLSDSVATETGDRMYVSSLYRSPAEQAEIYAEDPVYALPPGYSEHHTGLAVDVYVNEYAGANFINSAAGQYVHRAAAQFGFIIRYPEGKEDITKIPYEAWHIRYVGLPHSQIMADHFWVLEEYIAALKPGEIYTSGEYIISRQDPGQTLLLPAELREVSYSSDNTGYIIITAKTAQ